MLAGAPPTMRSWGTPLADAQDRNAAERTTDRRMEVFYDVINRA